MQFFKLIAFTLIFPGTVAGIIPYYVHAWIPYPLDIGPLRYVGLLFFGIGAVFYLWSALSFVILGGGTPSAYLIRHLYWLVGNEPEKLVRKGLYKISRNPMYIGVLSFIVGEGVFFEDMSLLLYCAIVFLLFNSFIFFIEEPHLKEKFGPEYEEYCKQVRRWI